MEAGRLIFVAVFAFTCVVFVLMRDRKEDALLKSFGLKPSKQYETFRASKTKTKIDMPPSSQSIARSQSYQKPITSIHNRDLLIFTWNTPKALYHATQRVFSLTSKKGRKFPKFICRPQGLLDKIKNDIDINYSEHKEFSLEFHLTSQEVTDKEVRKLFDNLSLHEYLLRNKTMGIESNGNKIFYFWYGNRVPAERFPKLITELENLHAQYFDI